MPSKITLLFLIVLCAFQVQGGECEKNTNNTGKFWVFVSYSMPDQSLAQWAEQVQRAGGVLVFRGFKDNSLMKTQEDLMKRGALFAGRVIVDPTLFTCFSIDRVPAVVVSQGDEAHQRCTQFDVIYGDIGLSYALKQIAEKGMHREWAASIANRMGT